MQQSHDQLPRILNPSPFLLAYSETSEGLRKARAKGFPLSECESSTIGLKTCSNPSNTLWLAKGSQGTLKPLIARRRKMGKKMSKLQLYRSLENQGRLDPLLLLSEDPKQLPALFFPSEKEKRKRERVKK